ncbi:MAG: hypothetical protein HYY06_11025 [Deltaproteobacteria bacterium]|nr:hypothetical protein [Deltaproteobacteria bacterium]
MRALFLEQSETTQYLVRIGSVERLGRQRALEPKERALEIGTYLVDRESQLMVRPQRAAGQVR